MASRTIFCAQCVDDKLHNLAVDQNLEVVATDDLGHFIKFPAVKSSDEFEALIAKHNEQNRERMLRAAADTAKRQALEELLG